MYAIGRETSCLRSELIFTKFFKMLSAAHWFKNDAQLKSLEYEKYAAVASKEILEKTVASLEVENTA